MSPWSSRPRRPCGAHTGGACQSAPAPRFPPGGLGGLRPTVPSVPATLNQGSERQLLGIFWIFGNKNDTEEHPKCLLHFQCCEMVGEFPACEKFSCWKTRGSIRSLMDRIKEQGSLQPAARWRRRRERNAAAGSRVFADPGLGEGALRDGRTIGRPRS